MSLDEATWGEIARLWRESDEPLGSIARRFAVAHQSISAMARRHGWPARPVPVRRGPRRQDEASAAGKVKRSQSAKHVPNRLGERHVPRSSMVERLFKAMDRKLSAIEDRIACGEDATPADSERTTRAINTLVRSLEKLTEYEAKLSKRAGRRNGQRAGAQNDPERRREELAQRIQRLLDRR